MSERNFAKDTSQRTPKLWAIGLTQLLIGLIIAHLGVTLFLLSNLGTDTFTVFIQGLSKTVGLSIGTCHVIVLIILGTVMLITTRGYVKPGTVVCAFCGGWIIDFFMWVLGGFINDTLPLFLRLITLVLGLVILSLGMSIVICSNSGTGPNDLVAIILSDKLNKKINIQFRYVRIGCDVFFVLLGFILGGKVGIGTILAAILTGPVVQFFLPRVSKLTHRICPEL